MAKKKDKEPSPAVQAEEVKNFEPTDSEISELIDQFNQEADRALTHRQGAARRWTINYRRRRGLIGKTNPNLPFPNSSDLRFRLSAKHIRELKPLFVLPLLNAPHIVRYVAQDSQFSPAAENLQQYDDYFYRGVMDDFPIIIDEAIDKALEQRKCIAKITWDYRCEARTKTYTYDEVDGEIKKMAAVKMQTAVKQFQTQSAMAQQSGQKPPKPPKMEELQVTDDDIRAAIMAGYGLDNDNELDKARADSAIKQYRDKEDTIEIIVDDVVANRPLIRIVPDLQSILVPFDTTSLNEAEWIIEDMIFTERELREKSVENGGKYHNVEMVIELTKNATENYQKRELRQAKQAAEGLSGTELPEGHIRVYERHGWIKRKYIKRFGGLVNSGPDESYVRALVAFSPDVATGECPPLRMLEYPYDNEDCENKWCYEDYTFAGGDRRYYGGESVVELLDGIEQEYGIARNAAIDRNTIALSPPVFYRSDSGVNPSSHRQIGQWHPVEIPVNEVAAAMQYPDLATGFNFDAQMSEQWANQILGQPDYTNLQQYNAPPTAQQVEQVKMPSDSIYQLELAKWLNFWGRVFKQVHSRRKQFMFLGGDEQVQAPNVNMEGETVTLTPQDFQGKYLISAGADMQRMNPFLTAQNEVMVFQLLDNPSYAPFAMTKLYDRVYDFVSSRLGPMKAKLWLPSRQEYDQNKEKFQQAFMELQAKMMLEKQTKGKNPPRNRVKQIPNASAGMMPSGG